MELALAELKSIKDSSSIVYHFGRCQLNDSLRRAGLYDEVIRNNRGLIHCSQKINNLRFLKIAHQEMAKVYVDLNQIDSVQKHLNISLKLADEMIQSNFSTMTESEKENYFAFSGNDLFDAYRFANRYYNEQPDFSEKAYNVALMTKGMLLTSSGAIRNGILSSNDSVLIEDYYHWIGLQNGINELMAKGQDATHLQNQANEIEKTLVKRSQEFSDLSHLRQLDWKDIKERLNEDEAVVEFIRFSTERSDPKILYAALIIRPEFDHPMFVNLFDETELIELIGAFPGNNRDYINQLYGSRKKPRPALYNLIWQPLEKALSQPKKVYVSSVGLLHKISFSALSNEQAIPLSAQYDLEMLSSASKLVLRSKDRQNPDHAPISLFGGIEYSTDATTTEVWSYLEGSLVETWEIEKIMTKDGRDVQHYTGVSATEDAFKEKATGSGIVHIATHGFFFADQEDLVERSIDVEESSQELKFRGISGSIGSKGFLRSENPLMRSGLVFAGANDIWNVFAPTSGDSSEDGILTAAEVATLDLRKTRLVVLSACETGLGDIKGSEGVYGLQRSFKMAGVNYLIMSLWQVPDKETAEFMTLFYQHLADGNDIKKSFRLSQAIMRKKYDPYYWAAFILVE